MREQYENKAADLASGPLKTEPDYRYARGYIDALRRVIEESREMTRIDEQAGDED